MALPFSIVAPAALASLAYLNARTQFSHDFTLLSSKIKLDLLKASREKKDRVNFFYEIEQQAQSKRSANHPCLVYEGTTWTYKELYDVVLKYAAWLKTTCGIAPGEIVALDFMNSPKFIFVWFALWSLGAVPAFINYNLTSQPLLHCIRTAKTRIIFVDDEVKDKFSADVLNVLASSEFRDGKGPVEVVYLDAKLESKITALNGIREPNSSRSGPKIVDKAILIYTSGTTGLPKAGIVSWSKCYTGATFFKGWMGMKQTDRFYTCMPIYHATATVLGLLPCLALGCTTIVGHKFSNRLFWPEVRAGKATIIQYVGETCRYLLAAPPLLDPKTGSNLDREHDVRMAFGNGLRPDIWEKFKERFGIETVAEFYSATEGTTALWNISSNSSSTGAIGRGGMLYALIARFKMAIVELDWDGEGPRRDPERKYFCTKVPRNAPGELLAAVNAADIKQDYQGYYENDKATDSKIMRDVFSKGDAWFRTGDIIRQDKEGKFWFCDRVGDTFRWKSENVSTNEVAEVLGVHPAVVDANVYGVELPNHDGRAGCVAILFNQDLDEQLSTSLARHTSQKLPRYALPIFLRVVKELQATGNNKQQKHILRKEGVDLDKVSPDDKMYWLRNGKYVEFTRDDWGALRGGSIKL